MDDQKRQEIADNIKAITGSDWQEWVLYGDSAEGLPYSVNHKSGRFGFGTNDNRSYIYVLKGLMALGAPIIQMPSPKPSKLRKLLDNLFGRFRRQQAQAPEATGFHPRQIYEIDDSIPENEPWLDRLAPISLRGRIAFALCVIENAIEVFGHNSERWTVVMDNFWEFVESNRIDIGHFADLLPANVMNDQLNDLLDTEKRYLVSVLYSKAEPDLLVMLEQVVAALFVWDWGLFLKNGIECSTHVSEVIKLAESRGIPLPDLEAFAAFPFQKDHPWAAEPGAAALRRIR